MVLSLDLDQGLRVKRRSRRWSEPGPGKVSGREPRLEDGSSFEPGLKSKVSVGSDGALVLRGSELGDSGLYFCSISEMTDADEK